MLRSWGFRLGDKMLGNPKEVSRITIIFRDDKSYNLQFNNPQNISVARLQNAVPQIFKEYHARLMQIRHKALKEREAKNG